MKRIFLLLLTFLLIGSVCAVDYSNVSIDGADFQIPPQYSQGTLDKGKYVFEELSTFAILHVDDYIVSNYGGMYKIADFKEKISVGERPAMLLTYYNTYIKDNVSQLYFPVGESVYCIYFRGNNVTSDISNIVETAPPSEMTSEDFYGILSEAKKEHDCRKYLDDLAADYSGIASTRDSASNSNDDQIVKWYLLTHWR